MVYYTQYDSTTKTWSGLPLKPVYNPHVSIASVIFNALSRNPDHIGQINDNNGVQLTNEQICVNAIRLAMNLRNGPLGVRRNDVIGLVSKNHEKVSAVVFAAFALAAPINTLDSNLMSSEIAHMFKLTRPSIVFCDSDALPQVQKALQILGIDITTPVVMIDQPVDDILFVDDLLVPQPNEHLFVPNEFDDGTKQTAVIICSSGTTGPSKGVSISHALLLQQLSTFMTLQPNDVYLSFSSLYWLTGVAALVAGSLFGITRIITTCPFDASLCLKIIERYGVTITLIAPYHLAELLQCEDLHKTNLSTIKSFMCGGGMVANEHIERMNKLLPVNMRNVYGLSEIGGMLAGNVDGRPGSVGVLRQGIHVRIVGENENLCGPNTDGEIYVRVVLPMTGYWNETSVNAESFNSGGWFKTGDIGHFDDDGYLYLVDRKKDIMKYHGHQISPSEVENVILQCPGVATVCVVGIWDDELTTELPAAAVVKESGQSVNIDDINAIVKETLSDAKQLRGGVFFVSQLPTTPSGKILRRKVRDMLVQMQHNASISK